MTPEPRHTADYVVALTKIAESDKLPCLRCGDVHPWRCSAHPEPFITKYGACVVPSCRAGGTWRAESDGHWYEPMSVADFAKLALRQIDGRDVAE